MKEKKIIVAKNAGFCFGVKRAVDMVDELLKGKKEIYAIGELVHNNQVIETLEMKGLKTVKSLNEIPDGSVMIIRSHGAPIDVIEGAKNRGIEIIDATCPFVNKARIVANNFYKKGYGILICGDKNHAEIIGINSLTDNSAQIINDAKQLEDISFEKNIIGVMSQTTYKLSLLKEVVSGLLDGGYKKVVIENTICLDSATKQAEIKSLAQEVDLMIVVGGKSSSNTNKLAEISKAVGTKTHHIEIADELKLEWFDKANNIGVAAGASTAQFLIDEVVNGIEKIVK
ncbi:MAG: 4-hydroxy-3-methylbut-2-enyl diphosphate reductase [Candidatus Moranbacteria bacterium GW2011_GWF1_34_10]|nr:MAG: 4-hydroxy-3-methylbut-2-enyl diphosphate reductase [Candidatus Moranbacteria bacterium GW2011_GWF1_34_10]